MLNQRPPSALPLLGLIFILGLGIGFWLPRLARFNSGPRIYSTAMVLQQVKTLSELVTVEYVLERTVVIEVPPEGVLRQMFEGQNRLLMVVHGNVKAGLDLSQIQPGDIQVLKKRISIKLPPARITDAYLDEKQTRVVERSTGFLRSFDKDLEQSTRQTAVEDLRRAARVSGILKDADERGRMQLKNLFNELGFEEVDFR